MTRIHPGEILYREFMEPLGLSCERLARDLGLPVDRIRDIVDGRRPVTADTARRLARRFGTSAGFWNNLQRRFEGRRNGPERR